MLRRRRRPPAPGLAAVGRHEQRAQAAEAVRGHEAERDQLGERLLDLGAQQAGALDQLVEERRALLPNEVGDRLRPGTRPDRVRRRRERRPVPGMTPRQQGDRRGAHRRHAALAAVRSSVARAEARPRDPSGQALIIEPARLVLGEARRQDLGLPGAGRSLEAFELGDDHLERVRPLHARVRRDALPAEQEAQEVARGDRLDLGAQALDRVVVDPGEQPALAPFVRGRRRREAPAHDEAFGLKRRERGCDLVGLEPERRRERALRDRPQALEPAAQDLDQRLIARPVAPAACGRGAAIAGSSLASGQSAWNCGRRSAAIQSVARGACSRATRRSRASAASHSLQLGSACASSALRKPSQTSASCSSSAFAASGQASARTRAIASGSSRPRSDASSGASQRRLITAWVRRSSSGASSR